MSAFVLGMLVGGAAAFVAMTRQKDDLAAKKQKLASAISEYIELNAALEAERAEAATTTAQAHAVLREVDRLNHMRRSDCKRNGIEVNSCDD